MAAQPNKRTQRPATAKPARKRKRSKQSDVPPSEAAKARQLLNACDLASIFQCSVFTIRRRVKSDPDFPRPLPTGGPVMVWRPSTIDAYLDRLEVTSQDAAN